MKKLFKAIKQNDFKEVQRIIENNPKLANCVSKAPPKMDDGQSALQVAIKNGGGWHDTRIISYLLDKGADVNFMEDDKGLRPQEISCLPILADMAYAVYGNATRLNFKYDPKETKSKADEFIAAFARMLELGADPNKTDNRIQPVWSYVLSDGYGGNYISSDDENKDNYNAFLADITTRLMDMMISHGANIYRYYISYPKEDERYTRLYPYDLQAQIFLNNLVFNRELSYGISEEGSFLAKRKWVDLMKPYYAKDNPYYGATVSEERKRFFQELEQLKNEEEKDI